MEGVQVSPRQPVSFTTEPPEATVIVAEIPLGRTPVTLDLERKRNHAVRSEIDGYQPELGKAERKINGWTVGNVLFGGSIGFVVDATSGPKFILEPDHVHVNPVANEAPTNKTLTTPVENEESVRNNSQEQEGVLADTQWSP